MKRKIAVTALVALTTAFQLTGCAGDVKQETKEAGKEAIVEVAKSVEEEDASSEENIQDTVNIETTEPTEETVVQEDNSEAEQIEANIENASGSINNLEYEDITNMPQEEVVELPTEQAQTPTPSKEATAWSKANIPESDYEYYCNKYGVTEDQLKGLNSFDEFYTIAKANKKEETTTSTPSSSSTESVIEWYTEDTEDYDFGTSEEDLAAWMAAADTTPSGRME